MFEIKLVYVCSPVRGDIEENLKKANRYCEYVAGCGHIPIAPHLAWQGFLPESPENREKALAMGLKLIDYCSEVWVCGDEISQGIPVYILRPDNTAEQAKTSVAVDNAVYAGLMLGMNERDKRLLNFYKAGNTLADLPFTHAELSAIFYMALDRGKENIEDEQQRKAVDGIIQALDTMLFSYDGRDAAELELDNELDEGVEQ